MSWVLSRAKKYKICSRTQLTIDPFLQSHFKWFLSTTVMLMGLSLLYDPGTNRMNPP